MKIVIIDDEERAAQFLREDIMMLREELQVVNIFTDFSDFVQYLKENEEPDLLLLDILQLDNKALSYLRSGRLSSPVLFTNFLKNASSPRQSRSGLNGHAFPHGQHCHGIPPENFQLVKALTEQLPARKKRQPPPVAPVVPRYQPRFLVKNKQKLLSIKATDVAIFYADGRLNFLKTKDNRKFICHYTIEALHDSLLDPALFFQVNRSVIISFDDIKDMYPYFGGRIKLVLNTSFEKEIIVSRDRVNEFRKWLGE